MIGVLDGVVKYQNSPWSLLLHHLHRARPPSICFADFSAEYALCAILQNAVLCFGDRIIKHFDINLGTLTALLNSHSWSSSRQKQRWHVLAGLAERRRCRQSPCAKARQRREHATPLRDSTSHSTQLPLSPLPRFSASLSRLGPAACLRTHRQDQIMDQIR